MCNKGGPPLCRKKNGGTLHTLKTLDTRKPKANQFRNKVLSLSNSLLILVIVTIQKSLKTKQKRGEGGAGQATQEIERPLESNLFSAGVSYILIWVGSRRRRRMLGYRLEHNKSTTR